MAAVTQTRKPAVARAPAKKPDEKTALKRSPKEAGKDAAKAPAYLQAKLAMSTPGDASEREADKVASQVAGSPRPDATAVAAKQPEGVQRASLAPGLEDKNKQEADSPEVVVPAARSIQRASAAPGADEALQPKACKEASADTTPAQAAPAEDTELAINARRGKGTPLSPEARADMEARFGQDFGQVRIHTDAAAQSLCAQTSARAFTVGQDVFFAPGEFDPASDGGRELLAHELTHVVQQDGGVQRVARAVDPAPSPAPASGTPAATALNDLSVLDLPPIKHRHAALYTAAGARRAAGYARNTAQEQITVWNNGIQLSEDTMEQKLRAQDPNFRRPSPSGLVNFRAGGDTLSSTWRALRGRLVIPDWDRRGTHLTTREDRFQVDHMVELQVFGDTTGNAGNVIGNMELLKGSSNASSGSTIKNAIYSKVTTFLGATDSSFNGLSDDQKKARRRSWLASHTLTFTEMRRVDGRAGNNADWWTKTEIEAGAPLDAVQPEPEHRLRGSSGNFVLASGAGGLEIARYQYSALQFEPATESLRKAMAGVRITQFNLNNAVETGTAGDPVGNLTGVWDLPSGFRANEAVNIPLVAVGPYCAAPGQIPGLNTDFTHLSPVSLPTVEIRDGHLYAEGTIQPSLPLISGHPIQVVLDGNDLRFEMRYSPGQLSLPLPGISVDDCSVALFYSTQRGFGGSGRVDFSVPRLGSGELEVEATQAEGFSAAGGFHFDTRLFDQADIRVWYRQSAFGGEGTLGINSPNKVRGIRSARLTVGFGENTVRADGSVQPDIPGIQEAALRVAYAEETGLTIGGALQLAANPAIRSGSIDVTVRQVEEAWKVAATGTAQPAIPGVDSQLTVSYDDGAFNASVSGSFQRGMLHGTVEAGATNRSLDEAGNPTGTAEPGAPIVVYGSGSATLQLAPWLQGTAGIRLAPNGEVTVSGEIGLPSALEIFPRREINRSLFDMATQIPIVPGIVAEVGGSLSAQAGIGPGRLEECRIGIEYNPAHEENTHITGDAHLNVPADAGVRLAARAGVGLGITGASATGGLELGGALGIAGAAEAGVHIDWMPGRGLQIDAEGYLHAEPRFRFDVSGYVSVRALGFSVYDNRWELAAYELGSNLRLGVRFPVHYAEGQPFNVSLDDVQFEVPNIDAVGLVRDLGNQIF